MEERASIIVIASLTSSMALVADVKGMAAGAVFHPFFLFFFVFAVCTTLEDQSLGIKHA